jgi:hypothetical protein
LSQILLSTAERDRVKRDDNVEKLELRQERTAQRGAEREKSTTAVENEKN